MDLVFGEFAARGVGVGGGVVLCPAAHYRWWCLAVVIHLPVGSGRDVGRMRAIEGDVEEEGFGLIAAFEEVDGAGHRPGGGVEVLGEVPFSCDPGVEIDAVVVGRNSFWGMGFEPFSVGVLEAWGFDAACFVDLGGLEAHEGVLGGEVGFAGEVGLVAGVGEFAGEGVRIIRKHLWLLGLHREDAGVPLGHAGPEHGPCGDT